jgi:Dyp-type peroxidase family
LEYFIFFEVLNVASFKKAMKDNVINRITSAQVAHKRDVINQRRKKLGEPQIVPWLGLNVSFTKDGLTQLLGTLPANLDPSFQAGAVKQAASLNDPLDANGNPIWKAPFLSGSIHGVFFITGPDEKFVDKHHEELLKLLGSSVQVVYEEKGHVRPDAEKGHEHFGFLDGVSQPGIRGLTERSNPTTEPDQGLPGQDLIWPGEFVIGYPKQNPNDPVAPGPTPALPAPWLKNGSYMVFRRLEQKVPEFKAFASHQATALGTGSELMASRIVGRWRSGAPVELTPLQDDSSLGPDSIRNNEFAYGNDRFSALAPTQDISARPIRAMMRVKDRPRPEFKHTALFAPASRSVLKLVRPKRRRHNREG